MGEESEDQAFRGVMIWKGDGGNMQGSRVLEREVMGCLGQEG